MTAGFSGASYNSRSGMRCRFSRNCQIAEFLVFPGDVRAFGLPMDARAGNALGEMTPVRRLKRARMRMRAGRDHMRGGLDQLTARDKNPLPPGRCSRFDDHQSVRSPLPEPLQNRMPDRGASSFRI